jgi:hypothetical protein
MTLTTSKPDDAAEGGALSVEPGHAPTVTKNCEPFVRGARVRHHSPHRLDDEEDAAARVTARAAAAPA